MAKRTLRQRLLASFLIISILPTLVGLYLFYQISADHSWNQLLQRSQRDLNQVMQQVRTQMDQVSDLTNWVTHNDQILQLLRRPAQQANQYDMLLHTVITDLENQLSYRALNPYLQSLFLRGTNGLDIRAGSEASLNSEEDIKTLLNSTSYDATYWGGCRQNSALFTNQAVSIPYCYPIRDLDGTLLGWLAALFSEDLFVNQYEGFSDNSTTPACLYNGNGELLCGTPISLHDRESVQSMVSDISGWTMEIYILKAAFQEQKKTLLIAVILLGGLITISLFILSWQMNRMLVQPIDRIAKQVNMITIGKFGPQKRRLENTELDELGNRILDMQQAIQQLMRKESQREQDKQKLEIQVLQAQMNPHFLYNTLNTIRLMASMQGKKSISTMIEALEKILHANLLTQEDCITVEQELELLKCYMYIQNVQQKGRLQWEIIGMDAQLLQQQIPKFLLQPLVENAIMHGFPNTMDEGLIVISGSHSETQMCLVVQDNGMGMSEERVEKLRQDLREPQEAQALTGHGIALRNVQRRIQLHYGKRYGITVESTLEKGCRVQVLLPYHKIEGGKTCVDGES